MLAFLTPIPEGRYRLCPSKTQHICKRNSIALPRIQNKTGVVTLERLIQFQTTSSMQSDNEQHEQQVVNEAQTSVIKDRKLAWKNAAAAVIEDFITMGTNVCIGDGDSNLLIQLLDTIDVHMEVNRVLDIAFTASTPSVMRMLQNRNLPTDLSVNMKSSIDVYIAPITSMDPEFNIVLDGDDVAADRFAIDIAHRAVYLIHEHDLLRGEEHGILKFSVKLSPFAPDSAVRMLTGSSDLRALGLKDVVLQQHDGDNGCIAEVLLADDARPAVLYQELKSLSCVQAVALYPGSESAKCVVVVAPPVGATYDLTPSMSTLATFPSDKRRTALTDVRLREVVDELKGWRVVKGATSALIKLFVFDGESGANYFVRHVQEVSRKARHHAEIRQTVCNVRICVTTFDAGGVTELDVLFARYLNRAFDNKV